MTGGPPARSVPGRGRLCSVRGTAVVWHEARLLELLDELLASQEALRLTRELGEDERSPATGSSPSGKRGPREREDEEPGARPGHASRLANGGPELRRRSRQIPDAVCDRRDPRTPTASGRCSIGAITRLRLPAGHSARARPAAASQHRPGQIEPDDVPAEAGERNRVAARPAAEVERAPGAAFAFLGSEPHQRRIRRRLREAGDRAGRAPGRAVQRVDHAVRPASAPAA